MGVGFPPRRTPLVGWKQGLLKALLLLLLVFMPLWPVLAQPSGAVSVPAAPASSAAPASTPVPPEAPSPTVPKFKYEDRIIEGSSSDDSYTLLPGEGKDEGQGLRLWVVEPRLTTRNSSAYGRTQESGLSLMHRFESANHGDFTLEASVRQRSSDATLAGFQNGSSSKFTIYQSGMPLSGGRSWSNIVGATRTLSPDILASGYRFSLPSSLLLGAGTYLAARNYSLQFEAGELAQLEGLDSLGAKKLDGRVESVAFSRQFQKNWRFSAQAIHVAAGPTMTQIPTYTGQAMAAAYDSDVRRLRWKAVVVMNQVTKDPVGSSPGSAALPAMRKAFWWDFGLDNGFDSWRASVWRFDPQVNWMSSVLSSGQSGLWGRFDRADPHRYFGVGVELSRNDSLMAGRAPFNGTAINGSYGQKVDRYWSWNAQAYLRQQTPGYNDGQSESQRFTSFNVSVGHTAREKTDRYQLAWSQSQTSVSTRLVDVTWTRDISLSDDQKLGWTIGAAQEQNSQGRHFRPTAGVTWNRFWSSGQSLSAWLRYSQNRDSMSTAAMSSGNLQWIYPVSKDWSLRTQAVLNATRRDQSSPLYSFSYSNIRENQFWLSLRYQDMRGEAMGLAGRGAGTLKGLVFYDDNRDGKQQADERPASGITIILDTGHSVVTSPDGRWEFPLVRAGEHRYRIDIDSIRLPWGLKSELPVKVDIEPRGSVSSDTGLIRVGD